MSSKLTVLTASMTGTSELVAEEVEYRLRPLGFDIKIVPMDNAQPDVLEPGGRYIFCTSTYGQGDIPDNGKAFFAALEKLAPDLSGISYTVIALGDLTYAATFCNGGLTFDRLLQHLGATRFTDILRLDASSGLLAEDTAADWAESWASPHTASSA